MVTCKPNSCHVRPGPDCWLQLRGPVASGWGFCGTGPIYHHPTLLHNISSPAEVTATAVRLRVSQRSRSLSVFGLQGAATHWPAPTRPSQLTAWFKAAREGLSKYD